MHTLSALLFTPESLNAWGAQVVFIAGAVYAILQTLKQFAFPNLNPKWVMALNVLFCAAGDLMVTPVDQLWTIATLTKLIATCASAAGIHGTVRSLVMGGDTTPTKKGLQKKAKVLAVMIALAIFSLSGCVHQPVQAAPVGAVDSIDAQANQQLQAAHAFQARISADIKSGKLNASPEVRSLMNRVNDAINKAAALEQAYHNAGGGDAGALQSALIGVQQLLYQSQSVVAANMSLK